MAGCLQVGVGADRVPALPGVADGVSQLAVEEFLAAGALVAGIGVIVARSGGRTARGRGGGWGSGWFGGSLGVDVVGGSGFAKALAGAEVRGGGTVGGCEECGVGV